MCVLKVVFFIVFHRLNILIIKIPNPQLYIFIYIQDYYHQRVYHQRGYHQRGYHYRGYYQRVHFKCYQGYKEGYLKDNFSILFGLDIIYIYIYHQKGYHQRVIKGLSESYLRVIRGLSEGYQGYFYLKCDMISEGLSSEGYYRVIRGLSEGYLRDIKRVIRVIFTLSVT